jgi:hypothetical protein
VVAATYLNVYDIINADIILVTKDSLPVLDKWLLETTSRVGQKKAELKVSTIKAGEDKTPTKVYKKKVAKVASAKTLKAKSTESEEAMEEEK